MHESQLILTLTGSLAAALALGFVTRRLGLSPIVGYLIAGILVGPHTPGFVANREAANEFAEIGVILLMFGVGLHFHLKDLFAVRTIAITGALLQSAVATLLGALAGQTLGWSWSASIVFGLALSVASTVMLTRVLVDNNDLQTPTGRIAIGWLVVEDIFTVIVLVLLPAIFNGSPVNGQSVITVIAITAGKLVLLCAFAMFPGRRLLPTILNAVAATGSRELFTLVVLVLALGIAALSSLVFGVSMALGAFLAGTIVGQSEFSFRAASDALPMRDAFAVLFFVSVGMILDPRALMDAPGILAATLAIILIGKPGVAFLIAVLFGHGSRVAAGVAIALAQIGEFSLILATVGDQLKILPDGATNVIVAAAIISLTLNPIAYRWIPRFERALKNAPQLWRKLNPKDTDAANASVTPDPLSAHAIVVGYGPVGRTLARLLREGGIQPVIIEMNLATIRSARAADLTIVYGDATRPDTLEAAGIDGAAGIVICGPDADQAAEIIRLARSMNPKTRVLTRSYYLRETARMRQAGADAVFSGEGEVALAMTEYILKALGATPEQMDRERQRVRDDVFQTDLNGVIDPPTFTK
jgi:CPA2 family monovalent cation:H+ antiporter-2